MSLLPTWDQLEKAKYAPKPSPEDVTLLAGPAQPPQEDSLQGGKSSLFLLENVPSSMSAFEPLPAALMAADPLLEQALTRRPLIILLWVALAYLLG